MDRVILLPTAETHPSGTFYLTSYEIVILQAGFALGDRTQLSLTIVPPFGKDPLLPIDLSLKAVVARTERVRVAAIGSATGLIGFEQGEAMLGRVGGVTQLCFDVQCRSSASMSGNLALGGPALIFGNGIGTILRTSDLAAFLFEVQSLIPIGRAAADVHGIAGAGGIRFSGRSWAVDLALEVPLDRRGNLPPALPFVAATYRFLP